MAVLSQISATRLPSRPISSFFNEIPRSQLEICNFFIGRRQFRQTVHMMSHNGSVPSYNLDRVDSSSIGDIQRCKSSLKSLFCYDKPIPEEIIEEPVGLSLNERKIGRNPRCIDCQAKGVILCATCSGSGLYIDSILESQGIIVKVRCLGCGGTGNTLCSECGGRGHL